MQNDDVEESRKDKAPAPTPLRPPATPTHHDIHTGTAKPASSHQSFVAIHRIEIRRLKLECKKLHKKQEGPGVVLMATPDQHADKRVL